MVIGNSEAVMNFSPFYVLDLENKKCFPNAETILKVEKEAVRQLLINYIKS